MKTDLQRDKKRRLTRYCQKARGGVNRREQCPRNLKKL